MAILLTDETRAVVQGMGKEGQFHAERMLQYGTKLVGGVRPGKGGGELLGLPTFNTLEEAVEKTDANASIIFVPAPFAADAAIEAVGRIDILVNNAGCNVRKPAVDVTWDDWNLILETNLRGMFFVSQAIATRSMIPNRYGRIVNVGSYTTVAGFAGLAPYCASRGGVRQMTMALADDWGVHGITVNCLSPGWFKTAQNQALYEDEEWVASLCERLPLERPGRPHDLDGAVVFLASDASEYVTGQNLLVDGGMSTGAVRALPKTDA